VAVTEEVKKPRKNGNQAYKEEHLIEDPNGINALFKTFTMHKETVDNLRGKGHEVSDLNKIVQIYRSWHLTHKPKLEYHYFLERVRKMQ